MSNIKFVQSLLKLCTVNENQKIIKYPKFDIKIIFPEGLKDTPLKLFISILTINWVKNSNFFKKYNKILGGVCMYNFAQKSDQFWPTKCETL